MEFYFKVPLLVFSTKEISVNNRKGEKICGLSRWHKNFSLTKRYNFKVSDKTGNTIVSSEMRDDHFKNPSWDVQFGDALQYNLDMWCETKSPTHPRYYFVYKGMKHMIKRNIGNSTTYVYNNDNEEIAQYSYKYNGLNLLRPLYKIRKTNETDLPIELIVCLLRCYETASKSA
ncbi:hypothetical protein ACI2JA_04685 [Alkalihalobacillus sp. NPDC078783]